MRPKKEQKEQEEKRSLLHFGRKIWKNTLNSEKYTGKSGKIIKLQKTRENIQKSE